MTRSFRSAVAVLFLCSIAGVNGDDGVNKFTYPATDGLQWNYRDTIITSYEGNISAPLLYTFCKNSKGTVQQERIDHVNGPNTTASIILDFIVDDPIASCWFNIRLDKPNSAVGANSANFQYNSTEGDRKTFSLASTSTSTSATASPTSSSTQSGASTTNPAIALTSATTPSASASASRTPGLSPGASAGVGVGVGLVGIAIGAGAVAFLYRRSKKRGGSQGEEIASTKPELMGSSPYPPSAGGGSPDMTMASELPKYAQVPNNEIHEAPAFQDGVVKNELGTPYGPYNNAAAELEQQKCRDTTPIAARQEMEATSVIHEMP